MRCTDVRLGSDFFSNSFTVEWIKHYLHDDHIRLRMQLTIYADGSMTFLYQNLLPQLLQIAEDEGYPVVIGVQEGFAKPDDVDQSKCIATRVVSLRMVRFIS